MKVAGLYYNENFSNYRATVTLTDGTWLMFDEHKPMYTVKGMRRKSAPLARRVLMSELPAGLRKAIRDCITWEEATAPLAPVLKVEQPALF